MFLYKNVAYLHILYSYPNLYDNTSEHVFKLCHFVFMIYILNMFLCTLFSFYNANNNNITQSHINKESVKIMGL